MPLAVDFQGGVSSAWSNVITFVPKLAAALLIILVGFQLAFGVFGPNPISDLLQGLIAYLPNVLVAIVIIVVAAAFAKAATDLLSNLLSSVSGGQVMAKGAGIAVLVFGAFAALDQLQIAPR